MIEIKGEFKTIEIEVDCEIWCKLDIDCNLSHNANTLSFLTVIGWYNLMPNRDYRCEIAIKLLNHLRKKNIPTYYYKYVRFV